jgi:hypothetical protein
MLAQQTSRLSTMMETLNGASSSTAKTSSLYNRVDDQAAITEANVRGKVQNFIMDLLSHEYKGKSLSVASLSRMSTMRGTDYGKIILGYETLEQKGLITVKTEKGVDTFLALAESADTAELDEKVALPDFTTNAEMIEFINKGIPAKLHKNGHIYISSKGSFGAAFSVKYVGNDYMENPRLNKIEHNSMYRFIFMMHQTPEEPNTREALKFEVVTGVSFMNKHLLKNPRFVKQKSFRAAAEKVVAWFKLNEKTLLDWSENL